jgi:ribosomal protein S12 methylthiotransferase
VIVVNTCSFIESAQQESVNTILEMAGHKTSGRAKKLVVAGCLVERFRDEIRKSIPEVDAVVGPASCRISSRRPALRRPRCEKIRRLWCCLREPRAMRGRRKGDSLAGNGTARLPICRTILYDDETPRVLATPKSTAYIKIAEGCDHPCTFCIIPQLRGQFRSRRFESVVAEAERLAQAACAKSR